MRGNWKGIEAKAETRCAVSGEQGDGQTESHIAETPADMGANGSEAELGQRETHQHPPPIGLSLRELWGREQGVHTQVRTHRAGREREQAREAGVKWVTGRMSSGIPARMGSL